eukprot:4864034-Pyramimonas_sp.AAC.1
MVRMRTLPLAPSVEPPYGTTKRVRGVPKWAGNRMRTVPLGPSVEPPSWGLRWIALWGHETCDGCAEMGGEPRAIPAIGAFGGWGHEPCEGCAEMGGEPHANPATGVFSGGPDGATNSTCEGCAEMVGEPHAIPATGAFGGAPDGAAKRARGVPTWA